MSPIKLVWPYCKNEFIVTKLRSEILNHRCICYNLILNTITLLYEFHSNNDIDCHVYVLSPGKTINSAMHENNFFSTLVVSILFCFLYVCAVGHICRIVPYSFNLLAMQLYRVYSNANADSVRIT